MGVLRRDAAVQSARPQPRSGPSRLATLGSLDRRSTRHSLTGDLFCRAPVRCMVRSSQAQLRVRRGIQDLGAGCLPEVAQGFADLCLPAYSGVKRGELVFLTFFQIRACALRADIVLRNRSTYLHEPSRRRSEVWLLVRVRCARVACLLVPPLGAIASTSPSTNRMRRCVLLGWQSAGGGLPAHSARHAHTEAEAGTSEERIHRTVVWITP